MCYLSRFLLLGRLAIDDATARVLEELENVGRNHVPAIRNEEKRKEARAFTVAVPFGARWDRGGPFG